jgi:hypothetical protein
MSDADPEDGEATDDPAAESGSAAESRASGGPEASGAADADADTFGVGIHVTERELEFVVHVPSAIGSGWSDPDAFQRLVERVVWDRLDRETTLRRVAAGASTGETVTLGTVTLRPDGTVVDHSLRAPTAAAGEGAGGSGQ